MYPLMEIEWGLGGAYCLVAIFGLILVVYAAKRLFKL